MNIEQLRIEETLSSIWRRPVEYVGKVDRVVSLILFFGSMIASIVIPYRLAEYERWPLGKAFYVFLVFLLIFNIFFFAWVCAEGLIITTKRESDHSDVCDRIEFAKLWMYMNVFVIVLTILGAFWKQDAVKQEYYLYYYLCPTICIRPIFMFIVQMYIRHMEAVMVSVRESESVQDSFEGMEMA